MALNFSLIGSVIGFFVGIFLTVIVNSGYNVPERLMFIPIVIPIVTLIVGAGTPRRNPEPEQGRQVG